MLKIFISYDRDHRPLVEILAADIRALGHSVWFDRELTGGQAWWDQILGEVRGCDVFVFALVQQALDSEACTREYEYADALGKPIMPVLVAPVISTDLLPAALLKIHFVDYLKQDKDAVLQINKALEAVPGENPLPDPLPAPPEEPLSYISILANRTAEPTLSQQEQILLVAELKESLRNPATDEDEKTLLTLVRKLKKRRDLWAQTEREVDELLRGRRDPHRLRKLLMSFSIGRFFVVLSTAAVLVVVYIGANSPRGDVPTVATEAPPTATSPDPSPAPGGISPSSPPVPDPAPVVAPPDVLPEPAPAPGGESPGSPPAPDPAPVVAPPDFLPPDPADEYQTLGPDPMPQALADFITMYPAYDDAMSAYAGIVNQAFVSERYEQAAGMTADLLDNPVGMELPIEFRKILWSVRTWSFYEREAWNETLEYGQDLQDLTSDGSCSGCVEAIMSIRSKEYSGNALEFALARAEVSEGSEPFFRRSQEFLEASINGWHSDHPDFLVALAEAIERETRGGDVDVALRSLRSWINSGPLRNSLQQAMSFLELEILVTTSLQAGGQ